MLYLNRRFSNVLSLLFLFSKVKRFEISFGLTLFRHNCIATWVILFVAEQYTLAAFSKAETPRGGKCRGYRHFRQ